MKILAIDVGIIHLAIIGGLLTDDYLERPEILTCDDIFMCELIDITELMLNCDDNECHLSHDKIITDYITHLFKKYKTEFETADVLLIERQPLCGLVAVQELIMNEYRNKSLLISPVAMLNFFGILRYSYPERKVKTEQFATKYLNGFKNFTFNERRHDLSDALCILYYYLSIKRKDHQEKLKEEENKIKLEQICLDLDKFKYTGGIKKNKK